MAFRSRRQRRILGIPVGKKKGPSLPLGKVAGATGAAVLAAAAIPATQRAGRAVGRGKEAVDRGKQMAGQASDVMNTASNFKSAVESHSSTFGKIGAVISEARKLGKSDDGGGGKPKLAHLLEQHTDIAVPRSVAYNQWTQLEMFPSIMKGVESVSQDEDDKTSWTTKIGPSRRNWTGRITEQTPDERIAWKSEGGAEHQGVVTFHSLDEDLTRVLVQMQYRPKGPIELVGNTLRIQRRRVKRDLRLFKHFLELRGEETGAWRGHIDKDEESGDRSERQRNRGNGNGSRRGSARREGQGSARNRPAASSRARESSPRRRVAAAEQSRPRRTGSAHQGQSTGRTSAQSGRSAGGRRSPRGSTAGRNRS